MSIEFKVPSELEELELPRHDRFCVTTAPSLNEESASSLHNQLDDVEARIVEAGEGGLADPAIFDMVYSFVRDFKSVPNEIKGRVLTILHRTLKSVVPLLGGGSTTGGRNSSKRGANSQSAVVSNSNDSTTGDLRNAFKMAVFLLFSAAWRAETVYNSAKQNELLQPKVKGAAASRKKAAATREKEGIFDWEASREEVLKYMVLALSVDMSRLWSCGVPEEEFISLFPRLAYKVLELPSTLKSKSAKVSAFELIAIPYSTTNSLAVPVGAAVQQLINNFEHLPGPMAELCTQLATTYSNTQLAGDLLREIGRLDPAESARNPAGLKNTLAFLTDLCEMLPGVAHSNISVLLPHLGREPYGLRSAIVSCIASIVCASRTVSGADATPGEGEEANESARIVRMDAHSRDALLDVLLERAHDSSSYTRSAVLRAWCTLVEAGALPLGCVLQVVGIGADRLKDKSANTRRAALQLLAAALSHNPYAGRLDPAFHNQQVERLEAALALLPVPVKPLLTEEEEQALKDLENSQENSEESSEERSENGTEKDGESSDSENEKETSTEAESVASPAKESTTPRDDAEESEDAKKRRIILRELSLHRSALAFGSAYESVTLQLVELLKSRSASDVIEALRLLVTARRFAAPSSSEALRQSLALVWHAEQGVREEVLKAFIAGFIAAPGGGEATSAEENVSTQEMLPADQIAQNLMALVARSSAAEMASLEEIICLLVKDNTIGPDVFDALWSVATSTATRESAPGRAASLQCLAICSSANQSIVEDTERLGAAITVALSKTTQQLCDWPTVRAASTLLHRCACTPSTNTVPTTRESVCTQTQTQAHTSPIDAGIQRILQFLRGSWCNDTAPGGELNTKGWFSAAEIAVSAVFKHSSRPEAACGAVVRRMATSALLPQSGAEDQAATASPLALSRLCFMLGQTALQILVYSENMQNSMKRARDARADKVDIKTSKTPTTGAQVEVDVEAAEGSENSDDVAAEQELGLSAEEEAEVEGNFQEFEEREIVGRNLLGTFGPILARIVANEGGVYSHPLLCESSVLALCKYMCISGEVCERYLDLLFTVLRNSPRVTVRTTIVVALGDLAFRFPNAIEPWNAELYRRLRDTSPRVRYNTLVVLTHVILNDMVKVKGLISDIGLCLQDSEPAIRSMAKVFFTNLSKRADNPIYNLLPDIVSRLSQAEDVTPVVFREIMGFLLSFIKKEKQTDGLLEKLCVRIGAAEDQQQRRDLTYCLAQLQITEKGVRRLTETIALYKVALADEEVYGHFLTLVGRAKKFAKPEMKSAVEEWEAKLAELHIGGADNEGAVSRAKKASGRAKKTGTRNSKLSAVTESNNDSENGADDVPQSTAKGKKAPASTRKGTRSTATSSTKTAPAPKRKPAAKRKIIVESSSDSESENITKSDSENEFEDNNDKGSENRNGESTVKKGKKAAPVKGVKKQAAGRRTAVLTSSSKN